MARFPPVVQCIVAVTHRCYTTCCATGVSLSCVEWDKSAHAAPRVVKMSYDGVNWEKSHQSTGIQSESAVTGSDSTHKPNPLRKEQARYQRAAALATALLLAIGARALGQSTTNTK